MSGMIPKIVAIVVVLMLALGIGLFVVNGSKNVVNGLTNGVESGISSLTGTDFDIDGNGVAAGQTDNTAGQDALQGIGAAGQTQFNFK